MLPRLVNKFSIKKGKKYRTVYAPGGRYKIFLKKLNDFLLQKLPQHPLSYAWTPGRNTMDVVERIKDYYYIITIDLKDFFHSINLDLLEDRLLTIFSRDLTEKIMYYCTYDNRVPQGFPTSPSLANFFRFNLDTELNELAKEHGLVYFVYGDDMIFAGNSLPRGFIKQVELLVKKHNLSINHKKIKIMPKTRQQKILGFVVNKRINIPKRVYENLYSALNPNDRKYIVSTPSLVSKILMFKTVNYNKYNNLLNLLQNRVEIKFGGKLV